MWAGRSRYVRGLLLGDTAKVDARQTRQVDGKDRDDDRRHERRHQRETASAPPTNESPLDPAFPSGCRGVSLRLWLRRSLGRTFAHRSSLS